LIQGLILRFPTWQPELKRLFITQSNQLGYYLDEDMRVQVKISSSDDFPTVFYNYINNLRHFNKAAETLKR
jgi:hypothetical protein